MIFESLWPLALFSAVPVVIILYLLKPRGKDYRISSNLLWDKLFRNQQSKTVLEKFIHNILMYLQILILILLVLALMSPYIRREGKSRGNVILVFDTGGSMQHDAGDGKTRMERAVEEAKSLIASSEETVFSIVTSDCTGTDLPAVGVTDKGSLYKVLDRISCCDGPENLEDAQSIVETLRGAAGGEEENTPDAEVIVFTDGSGAEEAMRFSSVFGARVLVMGEPVSNVSNNFLTYTAAEGGNADAGTDGIEEKTDAGSEADTKDNTGTEAETADTAGTDNGQEKAAPDHAGAITCASSLTNYSDAQAAMEVSLYEGEHLLEITKMTLAPGETALCFFQDFEWQGEALRSEISSVRFAGSDDTDSLADDNTAYAVAKQAGRIDAVLVGEGNTYLEKAYEAAFGMRLTKSREESTQADGAPGIAGDSVTAQTVRIYDAGYENSLPDSGCSMIFQDDRYQTGSVENVMLTASDCELTAGLSSFTIGVNQANVYEVPSWGTGFLWAGGQCAGYYGEHDGVKTVVVGFDIRESDFPLKAEFPVFIANAVQFLGDMSLLSETIYEAGESVMFHPQADLDVDTLQAETKKAGLYEVSAGDITEQYVVRFAAESQSDGRITAEGTVSDTSYSSRLVKKRLRNILLVLALILMAAEWAVYVRQIRYRGRFYLGVRAAGILLLLLALSGVSVYKRGSVNTTVFLMDISDSNEQNLSDMESYLKKALDEMPKENQYGIVTFGKNSLVEQFLTKEDHFSQIMSLPDKTATNFEDAVSRALTMIPTDSAGRVVILTDGRETKGNLAGMASALAAREVELLAYVYETEGGQDVYVENVELPGYLYQGDLYSMTVTVESNYETDARIQIWMGEEQTGEYGVRLNRGSNQFRFQQRVRGENVESFDVRVAADGDTCAENNSYHAYSVVDSVPKVLLISGMKEDSTQYESLLRGAGCDFDAASAANAPDTLEKLLEYKSILLENVYLTDLPEGFLANIETYVKEYGCGLVCIGGEDSFALGGYRESVLETVLPVDMELRGVNEIPATAMIMVIDHSGSMSMAAGGGATSLDLAVTAAKTAVDQMRGTDYVGVIAFDDRYSWVVEPTQATDKEKIKEQIETITEGGGTTIQPALWAALEGAKACDAGIRHVILLTDGQGESRNYKDIINEYRGEDVTLSTVAVGGDSDARLLEQLADNCGGRYYYSDMASEIPKIFAQEVFLSGDTYLQNGLFHLAVDGTSEITKGLFEAGWPGIYGYVSATPKPASSVLIASEKDDPVLTVMQYGLGHTAAWNTDVTNRWTAAYAGQSDYVQLWKRIVDYSVGNAAIGEDSVDVETEGGYTDIVYYALDYDRETKVEAVYTDPEGNTRTVPLQASAPGRFETKMDTDMAGLYHLSVRRLDNGNIANAVTTAVAVQYSEEYKFDVDAAAFTGFVERYGAMLDPDQNFWQQRKNGRGERRELTKWLILLLIFWFVMDIALRRFHFLPRDTKLYHRAARYLAQRKQKKAEERTGQSGELHGKTAETGNGKSVMDTGDAADGSAGSAGGVTDAAGGRFTERLTGDKAEAGGEATAEDLTGRSISGKKKRKREKKADKKKEMQTLDTSVLLQKKDQRKIP